MCKMASLFIFRGRLRRKKKEGKSRRGYYCEEVAALPPDPKKKNTAGRKEAAIARGGGRHSWRAEQKKTKTAPVDEAPLTVYDPTLSLAGPSHGARLALRPHFRCEVVSCRWRRASSGAAVVGTKLSGSSGLSGLL